ncbi:MAG: AMP-binding protein [Bacteroidales bacterium]|nr:AMP-binding protein [Bacteroidales bacterium]
MKRTVLEMLSAAAVNYKDNIYVSDKTDEGWTSLSFSRVEELSSFLAAALINQGVEKDDKIAIMSEGRSSWIISEYAVLKTRAVCVPLSVKLQPSEIAFRIEHSETKYVIVSKNCISRILEIKEQLSALGVKIIYLDEKNSDERLFPNVLYYEDLLKKGEENFLATRLELIQRISEVEENDSVTISYTSGTTGNPKGIMLTHLNYWSNSHDAVQYFRLEENLSTLVILPLDHAFAHTIGFFCATLCSIKLYFTDSRGGMRNQLKNIPLNIKETNPDFLLTVPAITGNFIKKIKDGIAKKGGLAAWIFNKGLKNGIIYFDDGFKKPSVWKKFFHYPFYALAEKIVFPEIRKTFGNNLKFFIGGGAMLDIKQQQFFNCIGIPVMQGYGLSEASPVISVNQRHRHKFGSSGGVLSGIDCKILNSEGKELPVGEKGYITVKGLSVMKGYFKNEKATSEVISEDRRLNTGDLGYMDKDNFLVVTGREKAVLISADGEKYSPEEIEDAVVNCSDFILQCVLYNDHCKYTSALITLDNARIKSYISSHNISSPKKMFEVIKKSFYAFQNDASYKNKFPQQWIPSVFAILPEIFTEQNKMVNSTMKVVRFKVLEVYKNRIERMNTPEGKNSDEENLQILADIMK